MKLETDRQSFHMARCSLGTGPDVTRTYLFKSACYLSLKSLSGLTQDTLV